MTPEIRAARLGKLTASVAAVTMGGLKTDGLSKLVKKLAWERTFGDTEEDGFRSAVMDRGNELEESLLVWYEFHTDTLVQRGVHLTHPELPYVGATPDGLIPGVKTIQGKCPLHSAWMDVFAERSIPAAYLWQCRWEQWVAGVSACDFVCWHPKAGGVIIPFSVTAAECEQMAERAALVEKRIVEWVEIIGERRAA